MEEDHENSSSSSSSKSKAVTTHKEKERQSQPESSEKPQGHRNNEKNESNAADIRRTDTPSINFVTVQAVRRSESGEVESIGPEIKLPRYALEDSNDEPMIRWR